MKTCAVKRCTKKHLARGYCQMHYTRWQTYGDPLIFRGPAAEGNDDWPGCEVAGCSRRSRAQKGGMCFRHYQRLRNTGSVEPTKHYLENIDRERLTGDCEICGPSAPLLARKDAPICKAGKQAQRLKYNYGVEASVFDDLVASQGGRCAICDQEPPLRHGERRLFLDHDHVTGAVRSALCGSCNIALGMIRDSPQLADKLGAYLRAHGATGYATTLSPVVTGGATT